MPGFVIALFVCTRVIGQCNRTGLVFDITLGVTFVQRRMTGINQLGTSAPNLGGMLGRILGKIVEWDHEYEQRLAESKSPRYVAPPTTDKVAKQFGLSQRMALEYLNYLQLLGFIVKSRRYSAGPTGYGYDGSLYSKVHATARGRDLVARRMQRDASLPGK
jgi:hypothetical protein